MEEYCGQEKRKAGCWEMRRGRNNIYKRRLALQHFESPHDGGQGRPVGKCGMLRFRSGVSTGIIGS